MELERASAWRLKAQTNAHIFSQLQDMQVKLVFLGYFEVIAFLDFVSERAGRLDIDVVVEVFGAERFEILVTGQPGLIDAFEMACSLGPLGCLVLEVLR